MHAFILALVFVMAGDSWGSNAALTTEPLVWPREWSQANLPGAHAEVTLTALKRQALTPPVRYRVVVIPGSGCTGWVPVAPRYFAGLLHAELLVLHKPGVDISAGLAAQCSPDFVQRDTLPAWQDNAQAALRAHFTNSPRTSPHAPAEPKTPGAAASPELPTILVGISEGAELLPALAGSVPALASMVMISAPGLDPVEAGELQAIRTGYGAAWRALGEAQASDASADTLFEGRTLAYWRSFWRWPLAHPLLEAPWPLLRVWGEADALVPITAYERFGRRAQTRTAPWCDLRLAGADHGLARISTSGRDGVQWLWAQLENWARNPVTSLCPRLPDEKLP